MEGYESRAERADQVEIGRRNMATDDEPENANYPFCPKCRISHPPGIWNHDFDRMKKPDPETFYSLRMPPGQKNRAARRQARKRARK